jgi:predicted molibdopterin-dependent oxidoreductase YjgC
MANKSLDGVLIKKAHSRETFTEKHLADLIACSQDNGYHYFTNNFFKAAFSTLVRPTIKEFKRSVEDKDCGPVVKTVITRCIHCTRCVRFSTEIAGIETIGAFGRGEEIEIGTYVQSFIKTELSGNLVDLCPVGALTSKPYAYKSRS